MGLIDEVVSGVKLAKKASQKYHDATLQDAIADLTLKTADLKMEIAELRSENIQLKDELQQARRQEDIRTKIEKRNNFYYLKEPVEGYGEGPFCPACLDGDGILVSMIGRNYRGKITYRCHRCLNKRHAK